MIWLERHCTVGWCYRQYPFPESASSAWKPVAGSIVVLLRLSLLIKRLSGVLLAQRLALLLLSPYQATCATQIVVAHMRKANNVLMSRAQPPAFGLMPVYCL